MDINTNKKLEIRQDLNGMFIQNLKQIEVQTQEEVPQ
jgi:hypothetical protein